MDFDPIRVLVLVTKGTSSATAAKIREVEDVRCTIVEDKLWNVKDDNDSTMLDLYLRWVSLDESSTARPDAIYIFEDLSNLVAVSTESKWFGLSSTKKLSFNEDRMESLVELQRHISQRYVSLHRGIAKAVVVYLTYSSDSYDSEVAKDVISKFIGHGGAVGWTKPMVDGDITPIRDAIAYERRQKRTA